MATTISITSEMKEKLRSLGRAGETYDEIIRRMYEVSVGQMMRSYLYDTSDSVTIDEALKEARKRWSKST